MKECSFAAALRCDLFIEKVEVGESAAFLKPAMQTTIPAANHFASKAMSVGWLQS
jgi:hypothetical protein